MNKFLMKIVVLLISFFCFLSKVYAAEILQVSSSSVLLIGDHNRTYTVKIACTEVSPDLEERSIIWLRKQLPRHTKVNLKPKGSEDGVLIAKVIPFKSNIDIAEEFINEGLATNKC
ncbi:nuclease [Prochlorococcus marinus]|uniref:Nuclease n=1 Tax=Prochlorococcus marinus XMU1408 TaxID=2213228 RepID=A0A318R4Y2_PROMR|nr:nuclease [Prochlorococcus marinus]MBW3041554.1 nuclease [Prochlorococcus marinus str. XMU1408]PYE02712.1 nuclease [Prochlorococcus marinus XMU1408]